MVQDSVLSVLAGARLKVYAVWEPILPTDGEAWAKRATVLLPDPRVTHFWVPGREVGNAFAPVIRLTSGEPAWDVYLLYGPGRVWKDEVPPPDAFQHQLAGRLPDPLLLDGAKLRQEVVRRLPPP